jgi:hypothetical protein
VRDVCNLKEQRFFAMISCHSEAKFSIFKGVVLDKKTG